MYPDHRVLPHCEITNNRTVDVVGLPPWITYPLSSTEDEGLIRKFDQSKKERRECRPILPFNNRSRQWSAGIGRSVVSLLTGQSQRCPNRFDQRPDR